MPIIIAPPETPLLVDTVIFSHLRNEQPYVQAKILEYIQNTKSLPAISAMNVFEVNHGLEDSLAKKKITTEKAKELRLEISNFVESFDKVLSFDQKAAEIASYIYPRLLLNEKKALSKRKHKKKKGNKEKYIWQDVFIVSTAIAHNYGLASPDKDMELIAKYLPNDLYLRLAVWKP